MQQEIIFGIERLSQILKESGVNNLFIVTGSHSYRSLNFKDMIENLDIKRVYFTDFTPNPKFEQICKGIELFKSEACDAILAIGGGSPMDVAKCIKLAVLAKEGVHAIIPPVVNTRVTIESSKIPFFAIPTTAGTGSESTHNAVMYFQGSKQTVTNDGILPDYAILEPAVLKTLPLYQKECTMMDALCQGIESWWSVKSTEESREYSKKAVELIMQNWEKYIFENDENAAANILLGANYSGRAINIAQTTAAHAMSYKLTSLYGLPHGHAVALCLPEIWEYMIDNIEECFDYRGVRYLNEVFYKLTHTICSGKRVDPVLVLRDMIRRMHLHYPISNNRYRELQELVSSVNPVRLKNNPIALNKSVILGLYNRIILSNSISSVNI